MLGFIKSLAQRQRTADLLRVLEEENTSLRARLDQVQGDIGELHQTMAYLWTLIRALRDCNAELDRRLNKEAADAT
jgi:phage shock protein A